MDDTACALTAISIHTTDAVDGAVLASFAKHLVNAEMTPGGPYRTWIVPRSEREKWPDVDLVVNANIAHFLHKQDVKLQNIDTEIDLFIETPFITSQYYVSPVVTWYFLARAYKGSQQEKIRNEIHKHRESNGLWPNDLETALAATSLIHLDEDPKAIYKAVVYMESLAENDIKPHPLYCEERRGKPSYSASVVLTQAFILEALLAYRSMISRRSAEAQKKRLLTMRDSVISRALSRFGETSPSIKDRIDTLVQHIIAHDKEDQITILPYHFACALEGKKLDHTLFHQELGVANLLGWVGHHIYDHILDSEGMIEDLPIANIAMREVSFIYHGAFAPPSKTFPKVMTLMDEANSWERTHLYIGIKDNVMHFVDLPDLGSHAILAEKSFGHALPALTLLQAKGYSEHSLEIRLIEDFFRHYLIARQMNDDAHDWLEDLNRGFVNSASIPILADWTKRFSRTKYKRILDLSKWEETLKTIFWKKIILRISKDILMHTKLARKALHKNTALKDTSYFESLLAPLENSARKAVDERTKMLQFIISY